MPLFEKWDTLPTGKHYDYVGQKKKIGTNSHNEKLHGPLQQHPSDNGKR
jgi:hypothetical protein